MKSFKYFIEIIVLSLLVAYVTTACFLYFEKRNKEYYDNSQMWIMSQIDDLKNRTKQANGCINIKGSDSLYAIKYLLNEGYCVQKELSSQDSDSSNNIVAVLTAIKNVQKENK